MNATGDIPIETPDFEAVYRADPDPWHVATSWYEQRKLAVALACLPRAAYRSAWEPGCGPGLGSAALAGRVESLVATDSSPTVVRLAERRCAEHPHVRFAVSQLPEMPLAHQVELVFAAEFLYYIRELPAALEALWSAVEPGGHLVFMHWAHRPDDAYRSGPEMHADIAIDAVDRDAVRVVTHADRDFLLDIYETPR